MSLVQPTTQEVNDNIIAQLEASLSQTIPLLPKAFNRVLAKVMAGVFVILYKYAGYIFLQLFVSTASTRETTANGKRFIPLVEWGRLVGAGDPTAATQAELLVDVTVLNPVGSLPSGSQLLGSDNGVTYLTLGAVLLTGSVVQVTVRASADQSGGDGSGVIGNLDPGAVLTFANPLGNVGREAVVDSQTVTGADGESWDVYRQRVADRFQKRPQGGAYADYEQWGEEVAGIVNVYPYTSATPGQVEVYVEATVASSGDPDGIPTAAQLQAVLDSIELDSSGLATRRPANALVNAFPITRTGFDVEVVGLIVDDPATVQADITAAVEDYMLSRAPYIVGVSVPPRVDTITQTAVASIVEIIVSAALGTYTGVNLKLSAVSVTGYTLGVGEKAKASTVSYI